MNNSKLIILAALVAGLVAGAVSLIGLSLVGNQLADSQNLGAATTAGITRYPNSGLAARFLNIGQSVGTSTALADGAIRTDGSITVSSGTVYASLVVIRDRNKSVPVIQDTAVTSTIWSTSGQLCQNPRAGFGFRTSTGTLFLASSTDVFVDCFGSVEGKLAFPITLFNASGTGNFVVLPIANGSSSFHTFVGSSTPSNSRATSTLVASSSAHLWVEVYTSSTGGLWVDYTLNVQN